MTLPPRIFVTGGSGFVGAAVIAELLARNYDVTALAHRRPISTDPRVRPATADLFDPTSLTPHLADCSAVIHLVGIITERPSAGVTFRRLHVDATRAVVSAAQSAGVKRYVHMSALGTRPGAPATYHRTKSEAEDIVRASTLDWTIFRPSLIHGPGGEFMQMEAKWARRKAPPFLFMPYFGAGLLGRRGAGNLQPVHVADVARAFADALEKPHTIGEIYPLAGPDVLTWPALHRTCATAITGKPRAVAALPAWYATLLTHLLPAPLLPFNRDQVLMSQEDNTADTTKFTQAFAWSPRPFAPSLAEYAPKL